MPGTVESGDSATIPAGARVFDITALDGAAAQMGSYVLAPGEVAALAGPSGQFFSDGKWLFSSDSTGLSRWDPMDGALTGRLRISVQPIIIAAATNWPNWAMACSFVGLLANA